MIVGAIAFVLIMQSIAPRSTDPVELMRIVGQASGVVGGIGIVLFVIGLIGRRRVSG